MNMFRDKEGMMPLTKAGLGMGMGPATAMNASMRSSMGGKIDPIVLARVIRLIEDQPELPLAEQLSANGVNGKSFSLGEPCFT
ncbi:MAG: hypothetical protein ACREF1_11415, partial [Acetobacteraceae bacterium]